MNKAKKIITYTMLIVLYLWALAIFGGCNLFALIGAGSILSRDTAELTKDGIRYSISKTANMATVLYFEADKSLGEGELQVCKVPESVKYLGTTYPVREIGDYYTHEIINGKAQIGELVLPKAMSYVYLWYYQDLSTLKTITVKSGNERIASVDGVLFDAAKTELIYYPPGKTEETFTLPKQFAKLESRSHLWDNRYLQNLNVEDGSKHFSSVDGVVYSKDGSELMMYPRFRKAQTFTAPKEMKYINVNSYFWTNTNITRVDSVDGGYLKAVDNALYTHDEQQLVFRPRANGTFFAIPSTVRVVGYNSLPGVEYLYIPASVIVFLDTLVNSSYPITQISHLYFESEFMPKYLQQVQFSSQINLGVERDDFDTVAQMQQGATL